MIERVLVVEGDGETREQLRAMLSEEGCEATAIGDADAAIAELARHRYDGLFCSLGEAERLLPRLRNQPGTPLAIVTVSRRQRRQGLAAVTGGAAVDCLVMPAEPDDVALVLGRVARVELLRRGRGEAATTSSAAVADAGANPADEAGTRPGRRAALAARPRMGMIGTGAAMATVFDTIEKVARHKAGVLISGESGTGKELVARAIHDHSPRKKAPFVAINCGAIPANLLESELFGYRRGAFTDAVRDKTGLFEAADGGTLFLDEIGELPLELQVKLLRALQEEEIRRLGDSRPTKIDVRIIAATLRDLAADVAVGRFREDLYYRLNVLPIALPPLRERREDIAPLVEHFIEVYRQRYGGARCPVERVSEQALALLEAYEWPGNIRELENAIERAMVLADGPVVEAHLLEDKVTQRRESPEPLESGLGAPELGEGPAKAGEGPAAPADEADDEDLSIKRQTRRMEESLIRRALARTDSNRHKSSKLLGISYRALLYKIKEYGI
ncbi:sigma 54-interacting transcriptional regulator [Haliangium sp.]|uniref:sigma 54-interacting transcriptional regulator n=1 Tax=Haliangium sp. TaxID=2663208 RepID=UPI003D0EBD83